MPADSQAAKSQPDVNQLGRSFQTFLARESSQQFLARLIVCCLTFGALTFCTAVLAEVEDRIFGAGWLFTALAILVAFLALHKQRSYQRVSVVAAVAFALIASWWVILVLFSRRDPLLSLGQLSLLALLCSTCPWPTRLNLCLCAALLLAPLLIIPMAGFQVTLWLIYAALIAVALWLAAEQRHLFFSKLTHAFLGRYCESGASASRTTLRILASHSAMLADSARALLAYEGGESELVEPSDSVPSQVDPVFVRGLMQKLDDYAGQFGLLARRDWGDQFIAPCHDWFGLVPAHTFFMRFSAVFCC
ncbi:MAG: hypothetical protein DCC75_09005 [Proteobacteria bacterium]|nr:MAG: hypothetical protein DCC75_09005 [Pseudomonadota bacterium]